MKMGLDWEKMLEFIHNCPNDHQLTFSAPFFVVVETLH